jgi:release factor glutamine methyltransferase
MTTTVAGALAGAAETLRATSPTPRLDAELLLAHALGWPRARLLAEGRAAVPASALAAFHALLERRAALEPVAYLLGRREFFGLEFLVDRRVLVPRPETELLVELALRFARPTTNDQRPTTDDAEGPGRSSFVVRRSSFVIADIGTGSGCIAVALAVYLPHARIYATDISPDALAVARTNAECHGVAARVTFLEGDLLAPLPEPVDLLVSNPPYTVLAQIDEGVRRHEPRLALDGGPDGLAFYRRLLSEAPGRLRTGGAVLLEIDAEQGHAVAALARGAFPGADVRLHKDLAGHDRVVTIYGVER